MPAHDSSTLNEAIRGAALDSPISNLDLLPSRSLMRANGPLYRQLADMLREAIGSGAFPIGAELPKEAEIGQRFGVSLITVRQALRELEADGLIRKRSAKPAVVAAKTPTVDLSWKFKNFADMAAFTKDARLKITSYRRTASPVLERVFGLGKGESGFCLHGVLQVGEQKKAHISSYFPPDIGQKLTRADFDDVLIFQSVQRHLGIRLDVAHCTVRAELADSTVAAALDRPGGSAILAVEMLYQSVDQRKVEFTVARHPADIFSITYDAPNDLA
jgi:GntR family transcriptional regulator